VILDIFTGCIAATPVLECAPSETPPTLRSPQSSEALYLEVAIAGIAPMRAVEDRDLMLYMALMNSSGYEREPDFSDDLDIPIYVDLEGLRPRV
jgi:hypothetical protein